MSNYSNNPAMCRIDFFKESGRWYTTDEIDMTGFYYGSHFDAGDRPTYLLPDACKKAMKNMPEKFKMADGRCRFSGMWAVVLDPYHQNTHPQMFVVPEKFDDL